MKKLISLVLIACMMLAATAWGENAFVVQNEQPPQLVSKLNAENKEIVGTVYNTQGEVVAEIAADGTVVLTDVHHRSTVENVIIVNRLTAAYESVMEDVHHSDVTCELHAHDIKVDIDMVLASLNHEMDAHDLVMFEMFDVDFTDAEQLIPEGGYVELTLEIDAYQPMPLIVMYSANGTDWTVIPYTKAGEKQITVQLSASGSVALLCDGTEVMGIGKEVEIPGVPGDANYEEIENGNFTPSVTGKLSPDLVVKDEENGDSYVGVILDGEGNEVAKVPNRNYIWVTATAERDYNHDVQTHEHLEWAFDGIKMAADVGELPADNHEGTIAADLDEILKAMGLELTHDQLVVKDLFEVTAYGDYVHYLYDEEHSLEVTFTTDLDPEKPAVVIHSPDSVHWHIHPIKEAEIHADGTITLRMYDLGAVAILVENPQRQMGTEEMVVAP